MYTRTTTNIRPAGRIYQLIAPKILVAAKTEINNILIERGENQRGDEKRADNEKKWFPPCPSPRSLTYV